MTARPAWTRLFALTVAAGAGLVVLRRAGNLGEWAVFGAVSVATLVLLVVAYRVLPRR